jgi:transcriptional regulator with XRE-family HTH domain
MGELLEGIGHTIRQLREENGWNQTELGFHAGASPSIISLIENGKRNPSTATLAKIAGALGVEVVDLFPKGTRRSSPELSLLNGLEDKRPLLDYRKCREALDRFCDYWEQALDNDRLDRRACEEFKTGAKLTSKLLVELWGTEKVELRVQRGEDPQTIDKSEPWPPGLLEKSELWPAIDRWMVIGLRVNKIAKERFGEDAAGTAVADLREYARRRAG